MAYSSRRRKQKWTLGRLKLKALLVALAFLVLCGTGVHYLHAYQVKRNSSSFLARADEAEQRGDYGKALFYLHQYLDYFPGDAEAETRSALTLAKVVTSPEDRYRVLHQLERTLQRDASRRDVRREYVRLAMEQGALAKAFEQRAANEPAKARGYAKTREQLYADARGHLKLLLDASPDDGELEYLLGRCHEEVKDLPKAARHWERALSRRGVPPDCLVRFAYLLRRHPDEAGKEMFRSFDLPRQADEIMDRLIKEHESFAAYLERSRYRKAFEQPGVEADRKQALAWAARADLRSAEQTLAAAELAVQEQDLDAARVFFRRARELQPRDPRVYSAQALMEYQAKRLPEALECLRDGLQVLPRHRDLLHRQIELLLQSGRLQEADDLLAQERKSYANDWLDYLEGVLRTTQGRWKDAVPLLERVRLRFGDRPDAEANCHHKLGVCYGRLGQWEKQESAFRHVLGLKRLDPDAMHGLAQALIRQGKVNEAIDQYRKLLPQAPRRGAELAGLLMQKQKALARSQRDWREIDQLVKQAAEAAPDEPEVLLLQAQVAEEQGRKEEALALYQRACEKNPQQSGLWILWAGALERQDQPDRAVTVLEEAVARQSDRPELRAALRQALGRRTLALLKEGRIADAEACAARMEKLNPEGVSTVEVRARVLAARGQGAAAASLLQRYLQTHPATLPGIAVLFEELGQAELAEPLYRRIVEQTKRPEALGALALHFARRQRVDAALDVWDQARAGLSPELTAGLAVDILTAVKAKEPLYPRVERWFQDTLPQHPKSTSLLVSLAEVRNHQGHYAEALTLYRKVLQTDKDHLVALNNVAMMLAYQEQDAQEALQHISQAVTVAGAAPIFLDTRGLVSLKLGRTADALRDLEDAVAEGAKVPDYHAHLALAYQQAGKAAEARAALQKAKALGFGPEWSHPLERPAYAKLEAWLQANPAPK